MIETGVIHGRFQIFHNDHLKYLLAGWERCHHLVVGITNPDPSQNVEDPTDPNRSKLENNPLSYFERYLCVQGALLERGLHGSDYSIVPLPLSRPELYRYYVPLEATFFLTIYDQWGRKKLSMFSSLGLQTEVLWERAPEEKGITSTDIRNRIIKGEEWEHLVPGAVSELLNRWNIEARLHRGQPL